MQRLTIVLVDASVLIDCSMVYGLGVQGCGDPGFNRPCLAPKCLLLAPWSPSTITPSLPESVLTPPPPSPQVSCVC